MKIFKSGFSRGKVSDMTVKDKMKEIIDNQPEDASYEEIIRELAFSRMIDQGLKDVHEERVISNKEMEQKIRSWLK